MSVTPGNFNETRLLVVRDFADRLLLDGRIKQQFIPKMNMFNYLQSLQNPNLNVVFNRRPKKDYEVEIHWMNTCADFTIDDLSCVRGGHEASTNAQTYDLTKRIVKGFTIRDDEFRDNEYDANMALAKLMLQVDKQITEEWCQYITARLNLFAGVNQVTVGKGTIDPVDNTITNINPNDWDADIMAYFSRVLQLNRFDSGAMISGSNLYETLYVSNAVRGDFQAGQDFQLWNDIPIWFDLFNVDTMNGNDLFTYFVSRGALAQVNKAFNPDYKQYLDHYQWTQPSNFMPGMTYDVYYDNACNSSEGVRYPDMVYHNYKIVLTADIFVNPFGCDAIEDDGIVTGENSGILRFRNIDPTATATPTPSP